jgi:hypothetical protein
MNTKTTFAIIATVAILAAAITPTLLTQASAKITEEIIAQSCTNRGGQQAPGQQPECSNPEAQTQITETENQNPSGAAPPGQNK